MGGELMLGGFDQSDGRRGELARPSRGQRQVQRRADTQLTALFNTGRHNEVRALLRARMTEDGMQHIKDVADAARSLASGDEYLASLLIPIVEEFARSTARDIRDFGRGH